MVEESIIWCKTTKNMGKQGNQGKDFAQGYVGFTMIYLVSRVLLLCNNIPTNGFQFQALCKYYHIHNVRQALTSYDFIPSEFGIYIG